MAISGIHTGDITTSGGHAIVGNDNQIIQNFYHSASYQTMESQRQKLLARIEKYPDDTDFQQELAQLLQQMEDFKRDVLKLAEDFQRIPLNTERLKLAKQYFDAGEYPQARAVLDAESITQEQDALLAKRQRQQEELATTNAQLDNKANEWLLKAQLTTIDYSLGEQRIATTSSYYEKALKSGRTPERLFAYAKFLQDNNQFRVSETLYIEALSILRQLANDNPTVYLPGVATTLNNLGVLVAVDSQRRNEAEALYTEALTSYRQLAKSNPTVYLPSVASTLNNLGVLVAVDSQRRNEAETLFTEALSIRRQLAKANPTVYLPGVAQTLNNLGVLVKADNQRRNEAETLYTEALSIRRQLAKDNPTVYLPNVANTLMAFGGSYLLLWNEPEQALPLLQESAQLFAPLIQQAPNVFGKKYDYTLQLIAQAKAAEH